MLLRDWVARITFPTPQNVQVRIVFGGRFKMTSKIVFPCLQNVDKAINYCKKPSKAIAPTVAPMLYNIVLVYINFSSSCRAHHNKYHST